MGARVGEPDNGDGQQTERLIGQMNPNWTMGGGVGIYPQWFKHLSEGGFEKSKVSRMTKMCSIRMRRGEGESEPARVLEAACQKIWSMILTEDMPSCFRRSSLTIHLSFLIGSSSYTVEWAANKILETTPDGALSV